MKTDEGLPWEQGSDLHLFSCENTETASNAWDADCRMYACGRDAFHALLAYGRKVRGWRRFLVPTYYCQHVVASFRRAGIEIVLYADGPRHPGGPGNPLASLDASSLRPGDVILTMNYFGMSERLRYDGIPRDAVEIIEDHTHDPWSGWAGTSDADWCVVSLRKTLPVPDGGVLWSPRRHSLPVPLAATAERETASARRLAAMVLKNLYLQGAPIVKEDFRMLYEKAEQTLGEGAASGMSVWSRNLLRSFPVHRMRAARKSNHAVFSGALRDVAQLDVMQPADPRPSCPFSCVVIFDSPDLRQHVYAQLLRDRVYPAVLWPLERPVFDGIPAEHRALSRRMLSLHCDARYTGADMVRIADMIREHVNGFCAADMAATRRSTLQAEPLQY